MRANKLPVLTVKRAIVSRSKTSFEFLHVKDSIQTFDTKSVSFLFAVFHLLRMVQEYLPGPEVNKFIKRLHQAFQTMMQGHVLHL